jgi:2-methylcitrate dehydratase PrpD
MQATQKLAQRIASSHFDTIPDNAKEVAKQAILDFVGVTLAGIDEPLTRILREEANDAGGREQAQIIGAAERFSTRQSALINGSAGHAHDYDDVHGAMSGHPTVPVAPAALALTEHLDRSGRDLITAFATGVDAECILGRYAGPAHYAAGWHNTGTLGSFGAAAASARLLQLDTQATSHALGIAGTQAAGLKCQFGTMCKPLHAGQAAATGLSAADLAGRGFTSCDGILETAQGFMATQSSSASEERFEQALQNHAFTQDICFKYHAACYLTHSAIEATLQLCQQNDFAPNDIDAVEVRVDKGHFSVCNIQEPSTGLELKFSLRATTAMALGGFDTSDIGLYDDALARDPVLLRFREKVRVIAHDQHNPESIVTIRTQDGSEFSAAMNVAIPLRDLPAQWRKLEAKFRTLATPKLGAQAAAEVIRLCRALETQEHVRSLCRLLAPQENLESVQ